MSDLTTATAPAPAPATAPAPSHAPARPAADPPAAARERDLGLDSLRILLALLVVAIHTGALADVGLWPQFVLVQGLARIAVPTFFVLSGFYFERATRAGPGRWLGHALSLYLLWMLAYLPQWWGAERDLGDVAYSLWFGYFHLWYLVAMAQGGLMLWLLRGMGTAPLAALASAIAVAAWILQHEMMADAIPTDPDRVRNAVMFAFPYLALGLCAGRLRPLFPVHRGAMRAALALAAVAFAVEVVWTGRALGPRVGLDVHLSLIALCPLLVAVISDAGWRAPARGLAGRLAGIATGIYLIHPWLIELVRDLGDPAPTLRWIAVAALSLPAAALLVRLNRRLPLL
ncbi:acyltransferase [Frigidibacter sp. MR17.24]|uniref:acyltransferase n=1 Tax=Frigidibacter sp. MR17.24 TaxID=3127345 RepID=UPI003012AA06